MPVALWVNMRVMTNLTDIKKLDSGGVRRACATVATVLMCAACASPEYAGDARPAPGESVVLEHQHETGRLFHATLHAPVKDASQAYPLVVTLHGCSGVHAGLTEKWRNLLSQRGIGMVVLDSFTPRDVDNVCDDVFRISPTERVLDALALLNYLNGSPLFKEREVFLLGSSHGGTTVLLASLHPDPAFRRVRGMAAYYPWCLEALPRINADLLVFIGGRDDWTPATRCINMRVAPDGPEFELVVYPEATHSFDIEGVDGYYYGHRLRHHAAAMDDSVRRILEFIERRL